MIRALWTAAELATAREMRSRGAFRSEIAAELGRTVDAVRKMIEREHIPLGPRPPKQRPMQAPEFAQRCAEIVETKRGHEAHRALDLLTNEVLRGLGYGDGIAIFEGAVAAWHEAGHPYPYQGPCPACESGGSD